MSSSRPNIWWLKLRSNRATRVFILFITQLKIERFYALGAFAILMITTFIWSLLGARLQSYNADQTINSYLFKTVGLHDSVLPSAHTFLIKWPLFMLVKIFGFSATAIGFATIFVCLLTVFLLAAMLFFIERRPIYFGTLCLILASMLLAVPPLPHPGALLPLNMAMLATRNIEYIVYVGSLFLLVKSARLRNWQFWLATTVLASLAASDHLFLVLSLGAALLSLIVYALTSGWNLVSFSARWLIASFAAGAIAVGLTSILSANKLVMFSSGTSPYVFNYKLHDIALGAVYAATGLLSNLGANPAFDTTLFKSYPSHGLLNLVRFGVIIFAVNLLVVLASVYAIYKLLRTSFDHNKNRDVLLPDSSKLAVSLIWSLVAAIVLFVGSAHYFAADARYLGIGTFSVIIILAASAKNFQIRQRQLIIFGELVTFGIVLAMPGVIHNYQVDQKALEPMKSRNKVVLQALKKHPVDYLVGDYWRVVPTKLNSVEPNLKIASLQSCTQFKETLTSKQLRPDLHKHSFAYLLSTDKGLSDYPSCDLNEIVKIYGRPNSSLLLAGNFSKPTETLLFYDNGIHNSSPATPQPASGPATVVPIQLDQLPYTNCMVPTIMNIVAHEDDDLLFMNPDLATDIKAGHCLRTIYLTAGDAGSNRFYWLGRQQGSEAAYSKMLGRDVIWIDRVVKVDTSQYITIANPRGNPKISLIFMYLPDGNMRGQGFPATNNQSLEKLNSGQINSIDSVYTESNFTSAQLSSALTSLMQVYQPSEIRTQSNKTGASSNDHSDHKATGQFTTKAYNDYIQQKFEGKVKIPLKYYLGYTGRELPRNVEGDIYGQKEQTFLEYSRYDGAVCHSVSQCQRDPAYGFYLPRQYVSEY